MRVSGIESTPNPSSFKFDLDQTLYGPGSGATATRGITYSRAAAQQQGGVPEAILRLLEIQGVDSVYALADWLCLNKKPSAKWDAIVSASSVKHVKRKKCDSPANFKICLAIYQQLLQQYEYNDTGPGFLVGLCCSARRPSKNVEIAAHGQVHVMIIR